MTYKCLKLKLRVFLAGHIVAMVTYCATKLTATYSPMIGRFVDTMILASTDKDVVIMIYQTVSLGKYSKLFPSTLSRLDSRYGVQGNALHWFACLLKERRQFIQVENTRSSSVELQWGVLQGPVLGTILYTLFTVTYGGLQFHLYADDYQYYVSFKPGPEEESAALLKMEACAKEIYA